MLFQVACGQEPQTGQSGDQIGWNEAEAKGQEPEDLRGPDSAPSSCVVSVLCWKGRSLGLQELISHF